MLLQGMLNTPIAITLDGFRAQQLPPETFYDLGLPVVASEIVYILELAS